MVNAGRDEVSRRLEPVTVRLHPEDHAALRREAVRRVEVGQARRIDASQVVRELVAKWRRAQVEG